ncbi:MAG TPA: NAD(P)-binding protein, partial [Myxococcaceae bacterium]|nr:NAD(P)-binding protein [Myxococcaceae bacterium]
MPKQHVAIVGGGLAALSTAYRLTNESGWKDRYELTVYQQGWRLGGKGASWRNTTPGYGNRTEEHGFHVFMAFYEETLRMLDTCYGELAKEPGLLFRSREEALTARTELSFMQKDGGVWTFNARDVGGPYADGPQKGLFHAVGDLKEPSAAVPRKPRNREEMARHLIEHGMGARRPRQMDAFADSKAMDAAPGNAQLVENAANASTDDIRNEVLRLLDKDRSTDVVTRIGELLQKRVSDMWAQYEVSKDAEDRRTAILEDVSQAMITALASDDEIQGEEPNWNLDRLQHIDFKEWLKNKGVDHRTIDSELVNAAYNLTFCPDGKLSAAAALAGALRFMEHRDVLFYNLNAGMGEVVFVPLYLALKNRGVEFRFFHQLDDVKVSPDGFIERVRFRKQATLSNLAEGYDPLVDIQIVGDAPDKRTVRCWPSEPKAELLEDPIPTALMEDFPLEWKGKSEWVWAVPPNSTGTATVSQAGEGGSNAKPVHHFVFAIPIQVLSLLSKVSPGLLAASPNLAAAANSIRAVPTQAVQLWSTRGTEGMKGKDSVLATCPAPFDTWADMSKGLKVENWLEKDGPVPRSLIYLCAPLDAKAGGLTDAQDGAPSGLKAPIPSDPKTGGPANAKSEVARRAEEWLKKNLPIIWSNASHADMNGSAKPGTQAGPSAKPLAPAAPSATPDQANRFEYVSANTHPSELYVLAEPGQTRLGPTDTGIKNLVIAGDWTRTFYNSGCAEAATLSGCEAAKAILGVAAQPRKELPKYIQRDGELSLPGPYMHEKSTLYSFFMKANPRALEKLCNEQLNHAGSTRTYKPLGGLVLLNCARLGHSYSGSDTHSPKATMREEEIAIVVPVVSERHDTQKRKRELCFFTPYLFVDNIAAAVVGREVYGFPKQHAQVTVPVEGSEARFRATGFAVDAQGVAKDRPLLDIRRTDGTLLEHPVGNASSWDTVGRAFNAIRGLVRASEVKPAFDALPSGRATMVFLKQFRSARHYDRACYQAVVETPMFFEYLREGSGVLPGRFEVTIDEYRNLRLVETLGLESNRPLF